MKKVLICYHRAEFGGVEKQILDIIEGLSKDFEISVAVPDGAMVDLYLKKGAKKHYKIYPKSEFDLGYIFNLRYLLEENNFDVVHAHELKTGVLAMFAGFIAGTKVRAYHVHTPFIFWKYDKFKTLKISINWIANFIAGNFFATDVIALTKSVYKIKNNNEKILKSKLRIIPNGVNIKDFKYSLEKRKTLRHKYKIHNDDFVILNVSRYTKEKGHTDLLDALKIINFNKKFPDMKFVFAGAGPESDYIAIKDYADKLNLHNITFIHNFTESDHTKIYSICDLFVFPSHAEGFGYALVEAMAAGRPVLSSDLPVLKDVGSNALFYFKVSDPVDLGQNMVYLINDKELRHKLSKEGEERAREFDMEKFWHNYKKLYLGELKK